MKKPMGEGSGKNLWGRGILTFNIPTPPQFGMEQPLLAIQQFSEWWDWLNGIDQVHVIYNETASI